MNKSLKQLAVELGQLARDQKEQIDGLITSLLDYALYLKEIA